MDRKRKVRNNDSDLHLKHSESIIKIDRIRQAAVHVTILFHVVDGNGPPNSFQYFCSYDDALHMNGRIISSWISQSDSSGWRAFLSFIRLLRRALSPATPPWIALMCNKWTKGSERECPTVVNWPLSDTLAIQQWMINPEDKRHPTLPIFWWPKDRNYPQYEEEEEDIWSWWCIFRDSGIIITTTMP